MLSFMVWSDNEFADEYLPMDTSTGSNGDEDSGSRSSNGALRSAVGRLCIMHIREPARLAIQRIIPLPRTSSFTACGASPPALVKRWQIFVNGF